MKKATDILCWIVTITIWLAGVFMSIEGLFFGGVPLILAAIFIVSPLRPSPIDSLVKNARAKKGWRIAQNILVIGIVIGSVVAAILNFDALKIRFGNPHQTTSQVAQQTEPSSTPPQVENIENTDTNDTSGGFGIGTIIEDINNDINNLVGIFTEDNEQNNTGNEDADSDTISNSSSEPTGVTESYLKVCWLDVGQGDCAIIYCDGEAMMVDTGEYGKTTDIKYFFGKNRGDTPALTLKYLCLTHPDSDHIGSAPGIISEFSTIGEIWMPDYERDTTSYTKTLENANKKGISVYQPIVGAEYSLGSATITILAPTNRHEDVNNNSIVFRIDYFDTSLMFTGDASEEEEIEMLFSGYNLDVDILKIGHHGSNSSSSQDFIDAVSPVYAVISVGENNDYYHPHSGPLNTLRAAGTEVRRTDEEGTIICDIKPDGTITWNVPASETWQAGN